MIPAERSARSNVDKTPPTLLGECSISKWPTSQTPRRLTIFQGNYLSILCLVLLLHQPTLIAITATQRIKMPPLAGIIPPMIRGSDGNPASDNSLSAAGGKIAGYILLVVLGLLLACVIPMWYGGSIRRRMRRRATRNGSEEERRVELHLTPWSLLAERERRLRKPKIWNTRLSTPERIEKGSIWNKMKVR